MKILRFLPAMPALMAMTSNATTTFVVNFFWSLQLLRNIVVLGVLTANVASLPRVMVCFNRTSARTAKHWSDCFRQLPSLLRHQS